MSDSSSDKEDSSDFVGEEGKDSAHGLVKGPWTAGEDALLQALVLKHGPRDWSKVSTDMIQNGNHRVGKQCRERYVVNLPTLW